jgi:hypothetical protein
MEWIFPNPYARNVTVPRSFFLQVSEQESPLQIALNLNMALHEGVGNNCAIPDIYLYVCKQCLFSVINRKMPKSMLWKIGLIPVVVPDSREERGGAGLGPGGVQDGGGCGSGRQL